MYIKIIIGFVKNNFRKTGLQTVTIISRSLKSSYQTKINRRIIQLILKWKINFEMRNLLVLMASGITHNKEAQKDFRVIFDP